MDPEMANTGTAAPLTVYVAWHPDDPEGPTIGRRILISLQGDPERPAGERTGIPVRFRTSIAAVAGATPPPASLTLNPESPAVVAIVAGAHLLSDAAWRRWALSVRTGVEHADAAGHVARRLVILATCDEALGASDLFGTLSALRLASLEVEVQARTALISVLAATADLLVPEQERLRIFISHAKIDGADLAEALDERIARAKLGAFLDSHAIVEGLEFDKIINAATARPEGAAVAIVTDAYASREWCRIEALRVKQLGVPLVALDALRTGQERTLPYLGNVPLVRLGADREAAFDAVLIALLREVVRGRWFAGHVARLGGDPSEVMVMSRPPELLTVLHRLRQTKGAVHRVIYPDPPLASDELAVLEGAVEPWAAQWNVRPRFVTPTTVRAEAMRG